MSKKRGSYQIGLLTWTFFEFWNRENLTKKINIDDISYEEINSKEKILTTNDSKEISKLYF